MTMVETAIRAPENLSGYFNTATSTLSPYNNNFGLYVYGTFPLYLVKAVGQVLDKAGYDQINLVGRASRLCSTWGRSPRSLVGRRLYGAAVGLLAGGLYALMALPIQQAHFFTVDSYAPSSQSWLPISRSGSVKAIVRWDYLALGAVVGFGVACKISMFVLGDSPPWARSSCSTEPTSARERLAHPLSSRLQFGSCYLELSLSSLSGSSSRSRSRVPRF